MGWKHFLIVCAVGLASCATAQTDRPSAARPPSHSEGARPAGATLFDAPEMRAVMSFNLRVAGDEGERAWEARRELVVEIIRTYRPLFIGTQEGLQSQIEDLDTRLPRYGYTGVGRQGGVKGEYAAIFHDKDRARLIQGGSFWLSDTPDAPGSLLEGAGAPRMASWGRFRVPGHEPDVYVFNTHLGLEPDISAAQAEIFLRQVEEIAPADAEVLLTGDFNAPRGGRVWKSFVEAGFLDAWRLAAHQAGPDFSFHDWQGTERRERRIIDWILHRAPNGARPGRPLLAQILTVSRNGLYPSDHFPVLLTSLGEPRVAVQAVRVDRRALKANTALPVSVTVENLGAQGIAPVSLSVGRAAEKTRWAVLGAGEERQVAFAPKLREPGVHPISVNGQPAGSVTVQPVPAALRLEAIEVEPFVRPGQPVAVIAKVLNEGSFEGSMRIDLTVDGRPAESALVTAPPNDLREASFALSFERPGVHRVGVDGQSREVFVLADLGTAWKFRRGDDPSWSRREDDPSAWENVTLPASWERHSNYGQDEVFGWYRLTFHVPPGWQGRPVRLVLGKIDDVDQTFVNGALVGQTGRLPADEAGFASAWTVVRTYDVRPDLLVYGGENTVAIRVYDSSGGGGLHAGPIGMLPL